MKRRRRSSPPEPLPLLALTPVKEEDDPRTNWQLVTAASERYGLPDGWCVEEIPRRFSRSRPARVDRYFIEPDTGQKFRSLVAVHRYLTGGQVDTHATMQFKPHTMRCSSSFVLPDGWEIEEKPRKNTNTGHSDKYYIEPGTGRRFRSLVAVERYLTEENEHTPLQALIPANKLILSSGSSSQKKKIRSLKFVSKNSSHSNPADHFSSPKKEILPEISRPSQLNISSPPTKVKWVLVGPGGNNWNPFMDDSRVADSVKQKWSEIFKSSIYDENIKAPFVYVEIRKILLYTNSSVSTQIMNTPKSSSPEPIPLMTVTPAKEEDQPRSSRQLQLVTASRFGLPDGWSVEERPRRSSQTVDKYYIELDTGLKFRSLAAARRYLTDGQIDTRTRREKSGSQSTMQSFRRSSSFTLPDGWEIEERQRKNTNSSHSDKYYIEPGTGKRFRSLISVERYLTEEIEHTPLQALMPANKSNLSSSSGSQKKKIRSLELMSKHSPCSNECYNSTLDAMRLNTYSIPEKHSSSPKKSFSGETSRPSELTNCSPPTKVKWVLAGPGGNMWNPFIDDSRVADSVKQMWSEIFKSSIYNENAKAPRS
ncbi:uncharacterized protein LOC133730437 [Rosa rugosa]|uniref:uncharacterized protein LOC133730437 n=1 Tax=Rosa rugosa TaxID=74645 RepID=UPI002B414636|nr:uncharacterized protein LOC133730437 [Rosa rugosa]